MPITNKVTHALVCRAQRRSLSLLSFVTSENKQQSTGKTCFNSRFCLNFSISQAISICASMVMMKQRLNHHIKECLRSYICKIQKDNNSQQLNNALIIALVVNDSRVSSLFTGLHTRLPSRGDMT